MAESTDGRLPCGCPAIFPDWDRKDINLGGQLAHGQKQSMFLHMPIGHEAKLDLQFKDMQRLGLHAQWPGFVLSRSAMFRGQLLSLLKEEHSPARSVFCLPRPFNLRVALFHGDVADVRLNVAKMQSRLLDEGKMPKSLFLAYLTCPRCQDERGGMQVMLLRQWVASEKLRRKLKNASA